MLEIIANGKKLQLPADIEISLTFENPLFMTDSIPAPYSMTFTLPPTAENLKITGNANRIAAAGVWSELESNILFNGITISRGKLLLQETESNLKFSYVGSLLPAYVRHKMSNLNIGEYQFGSGEWGTHDFTAGWSLAYKNAIFNQNADIGAEFAACPVRLTDEEWFGEKNQNGNYNAKKNYLNMWNAQTGSYMFTEGIQPMHGTIFPQPYVHHLLDLVIGPYLNTNFIKGDAELMKLCMITSYHYFYSYKGTLLDVSKGVILDNPFIDPKSFKLSSYFNSYSFNDFLKNILKVFCCSLMPRPDGKWDLLHNKTILENTDTDDWSDKLAGTPVISMQKAQKYNYGYGNSTGDRSGKYTPLASIAQLWGVTEGYYSITSTGEVFKKTLEPKTAPSDPDVYSFERIDAGLDSVTSASDSEESFDMSSEVEPVKMRPDFYWWKDVNILQYLWHVAELSGDRMKNDFAPSIGFMRGFFNLSTNQVDAVVEDYANHYPLLSPYNYDPGGNKVGDYSLAWEGADGLKNKFHSDFKAYIEKDRAMLKGSFRLTYIDLKNLDYKRKKYIRGKLYYLAKIETTLRMNSISLCKCEMVEA